MQQLFAGFIVTDPKGYSYSKDLFAVSHNKAELQAALNRKVIDLHILNECENYDTKIELVDIVE
jgi:hypothetical protein